MKSEDFLVSGNISLTDLVNTMANQGLGSGSVVHMILKSETQIVEIELKIHSVSDIPGVLN